MDASKSRLGRQVFPIRERPICRERPSFERSSRERPKSGLGNSLSHRDVDGGVVIYSNARDLLDMTLNIPREASDLAVE